MLKRSPNRTEQGATMSEQIVRTDTIICPDCSHKQKANVTYTEGHPFDTYIHLCEKCEYIIMEAEWEKNNE